MMSLWRLSTRYLLPALIIVGLLLYLGVRNRDRLLYELPQLTEFEVNDVDQITVSKGEASVTVKRVGDNWIIRPKDFPASTQQVDTMLDALARIRVTDLVSENAAYSRFELDPNSAVNVTAYQGTDVLRTIGIGKEARTYQHSYVMLEGDRRVYQAEGNLRNFFPVSSDVLRDKRVLSLNAGKVGEIVTRSPYEELTLKKRASLEKEGAPEWVDMDGTVWDAEGVDESLQRLANLSTFRFAEESANLGSELIELTLRTEAGDAKSLKIYERQGNSHLAVSSGTKYPFLLFVWMVNDFLDAFTTAGAPEE